MSTISATEPVLEARELGKRYGTAEHWALRGMNLSVPAGETLGIVGESGSGKSTLARLLLALEKPTEGEVRHGGRVVSGRREKELREFRRAVQVIFQDPMSSLDPRMRIYDIVAEPLRSLSLVSDRGEEEAKVGELLASVGLSPDAGSRYPHAFSGGQRQRIAIARALGPSPRVLIADEPVSALDVSVRAQILNLLSGLVRDFSLTLLFISHDIAVVRHLCTRVVVMRAGSLVEDATVHQIFHDPQASYTRELLDAAPRIAHPR